MKSGQNSVYGGMRRGQENGGKTTMGKLRRACRTGSGGRRRPHQGRIDRSRRRRRSGSIRRWRRRSRRSRGTAPGAELDLEFRLRSSHRRQCESTTKVGRQGGARVGIFGLHDLTTR